MAYYLHGTFLRFINCMGHSYGLLTSWDISMVSLLHGTFLWFINFMGHSYGLLTAWDIPIVY